MGNALFPMLPGLAWNVEREPEYSVQVQHAVDGSELRAAFYSAPIRHWTLGYEFLRKGNGFAEIQSMEAFYLQRNGKFDSFLFEDPEDKAVTNMGFGVGNGTTTTFQLQRAILGALTRNVLAPANGVPITTPRFNGCPNSAAVASWGTSISGTGVTPGLAAAYAVAPDGTTTAARVILSMGATGWSLIQSGSPGYAKIGSPYTVSIWLRSNTGSNLNVLLANGDAASVSVTLTTQWQRFTFTATATSNSMALWIMCPINTTADFLAWGGQAEHGSVATEYIPTTSTLAFASPAYWPASADGFEPIYNLNQTATAAAISLYDPMGNTWPLSQVVHTNFVIRSSEFDNAAWTKDNVTITANSTVAPDGTTTADTITNSATVTEHRVYQNTGLGYAYNNSVFAKAGTASFLSMGTSAANYVCFNLTLGTIVAQVGLTGSSIVYVGNGWYRCMTGQLGASVFVVMNMGETQAGAVPAALVAGTSKTIFLWGAQAENGGVVGAYIPTTTATVAVNDYTINSAGLVTLAVAPFANWGLRWTGSYYWRVRFNSKGGHNQFLRNLYEMKKIELVTSR